MQFKVCHPSMQQTSHFDSWTEMCEAIVDMADMLITLELEEQHAKRMNELADEIMKTVMECPA